MDVFTLCDFCLFMNLVFVILFTLFPPDNSKVLIIVCPYSLATLVLVGIMSSWSFHPPVHMKLLSSWLHGPYVLLILMTVCPYHCDMLYPYAFMSSQCLCCLWYGLTSVPQLPIKYRKNQYPTVLSMLSTTVPSMLSTTMPSRLPTEMVTSMRSETWEVLQWLLSKQSSDTKINWTVIVMHFVRLRLIITRYRLSFCVFSFQTEWPFQGTINPQNNLCSS